MATPHWAAIGAGENTSSGAISEPEITSVVRNGNVSSESLTDVDGNGNGEVKSRLPAARATKVVGSLNHPMLPMPPVSDLMSDAERFDLWE